MPALALLYRVRRHYNSDLPMTLPQFRETLTSPEPPLGLSAALAALWHDGRGDWEAAHRVAQDIDTPEGAWIHAYLHRKEGDPANAAYWYRRAAKPSHRWRSAPSGTRSSPRCCSETDG
jgi:hypothetical protein